MIVGSKEEYELLQTAREAMLILNVVLLVAVGCSFLPYIFQGKKIS
jgi:hypothetical protein